MAQQRTAVVTGANSGIGLETARGLARDGFRTVLACRSEDRALQAKADIDASVPGAETEVLLVDLGSQSSVREAAVELGERFDRLDLLVNNAGIQIRSRQVTDEGHDLMLAVNHLGPFLLTNLLLPLLDAGAPARIVTVASDAHRFGKLDIDDIEAERGYGFFGFPRYGETKLMNILFTRELARRVEGTGVTAVCVHPGAVRTNLGDPPAPLKWLLGFVLLDAEEGAATTLAAATDPAWRECNGTYFVRSRPADDRLNGAATDDTAARRLWDRSEELTGLD